MNKRFFWVFFVVCCVLLSPFLFSVGGVSAEYFDTVGVLSIGDGFLQGNIGLTYNISLIPTRLDPVVDMLELPIEVSYFVSGLGARLIIPLLRLRTAPISLELEGVPDFFDAAISPGMVYPLLNLEKPVTPEIGVLRLTCSQFAPAFMTQTFQVHALHEKISGLFGLVGLIGVSEYSVPIAIRPGYYHSLVIAMPSGVVAPPEQTVSVDIDFTNWGNARTQVNCYVVDKPEGWNIMMNSQVFIGTQVLGEDNTMSSDLVIRPPAGFVGMEELDLSFVSMAAGHPEAGVYEVNRTIMVFSS